MTSISLVGSLWTWALIVIAHLGYRKAVAAGEARPVAYRMPGSPYTNWLVVAFLVLVAAFLGLSEGTRVALYVAPVWFAHPDHRLPDHPRRAHRSRRSG